jgi:hypothetical protein
MATYRMEFSGVAEFEASSDGDAQTQAKQICDRLRRVCRMHSFTEGSAVPVQPAPDYERRFHARHDCPEFYLGE